MVARKTPSTGFNKQVQEVLLITAELYKHNSACLSNSPGFLRNFENKLPDFFQTFPVFFQT